MKRRYVIVGNGPAGWQAALAIRQREPAASVIVLTDEPTPCYMRPRLPAFLSGVMPEEQLLVNRFMDYVAKDIELLQRPAVGVNLQARRVVLRGGKSLSWDALLLATGSRPRPLPVEGGVASRLLRTLGEAQELNEQLVPGLKACIVGGGLLGMDFARSLRARKVEVAWLIRETHFWDRALDPDVAALVHQRVRDHGVDLRFGDAPKRIEGSANEGFELLTIRGSRLRCDLVLAAIGVTPRLEILNGASVARDRGILVDRSLQSTVPGIFAAGDVAQVPNPTGGAPLVLTSWLNAWRQGEVAGRAMVGEEAIFADAVSANATDVFGQGLIAMGESAATPGQAEDRVEVRSLENGGLIKVVIRGGCLVGAVLLGPMERAWAFRTLIRERTPVAGHEAQLVDPEFPVETLLPETTSPEGTEGSITCPVCDFDFVVPPDAREGDVVTCPACGAVLRIVRMGEALIARPV